MQPGVESDPSFAYRAQIGLAVQSGALHLALSLPMAVTVAAWTVHALGLAGSESGGIVLGALVFAAAIRGLIR